ncbi:hypothetical protein [Actinophytocola sediminis]
MSLDDELRRMFDAVEDRLDVPVRGGAAETIVAGANRVRRRRIMATTASGVAAVAVLAGVGILLTAPEPESAPPAITSPPPPSATVSSPPPASTTPTSRPPSTNGPPPGTVTGDTQPGTAGGEAGEDPPSPPPPPPTVVGSRIGPDGFGSIRLGMSYDELLATGAVRPSQPPPGSGCAAYEFANASGSGSVHVSAVGGAQVILTTDPTNTVDGVSTGWTLAQVRTAYPEVTPEVIAQQNPVPVEVRGNPSVLYLITFVGGEVVAEITLRYADQPCF